MNPFANLLKLPVDYTECSQDMRRQVREEYIRRQKGNCQHCGQPLTGLPRPHIEEASINESLFPKGFLSNPIHLHHNHHTGMTIGAIHARCNAYLWQYEGK